MVAMSTHPSFEEFIASIEGFASLVGSVQTDLIAYFLLKHTNSAAINATGLAEVRSLAHLAPHAHLAPYLSNNLKGKSPKYVKVPNGYALERSYSATLETTHLGRPAARQVAKDLRGELSKITDPAIRLYLQEAIGCFEYRLLRSAIVMSWCVAYGVFRAWVFKNHLAKFNAQTSSWKKPITIGKLEDFQDLTESVVIETAYSAKVMTRDLYKTLKHLLDQRNSYAHPSNKAITASIAEAFIENVLLEVLPKLK
jgi:hypothetical protein